jgi:cytochrome P450
MAAAMQMYMYADELAQERRNHPGEDLVSQLLTAEVNGELLSQPEFNAFFLLLVVAGNETTRNLLSGGLLALLYHRAEFERLRAEPRLVPSAVEEMLRYVSPVAQFRRTANRDIELHGQRIAEGDRVILAHASANRDESVFAEPDRFDIGRQPNPHLGFGVGPHLCLGASLARLEARCMFEELLPRLKHIELIGPVRRVRSNFVNGWKSIPIRYQ